MYKRIAMLLGLIFIFVLLALILLKPNKIKEKQTDSSERIKVGINTIKLSDITDDAIYSGTVRAKFEAKLAPKIMSNISAIYVNEGDRVAKGQLLVKLESKDLAAQYLSASASVNSAKAQSEKAKTAIELQDAQTKANIANAEASLKIAKEQLMLVKEGPRKQEKLQAKLIVNQADAQFRNAENELNRMNRLYTQGAISKQQLETTQTLYDVAKAGLEIAQQQQEASDEGGRVQDIKSAQERVLQAEQALRLSKAAAVQNKMARREAQSAQSMVSQARAGESAASVMLGYSEIRAPFSGRVTARYADPGDLASAGIPIISIEDDSFYRLESEAAVADTAFIKLGMPVNIEIGNAKLKTTGKIAAISPAGSPSSRKFLVKANLDNKIKVISGDFGRMAIPISKNKGILIPAEAIHEEGGIANVYIAKANNRASMRIIKTGKTIGNDIEILTGLKPGENVIINQNRTLYDDALIKIERN